MLAYIGPESVSAVASALAAVAGALLIGWRWITRPFKRAYRAMFGGGAAEEENVDEETPDTAEAVREKETAEQH